MKEMTLEANGLSNGVVTYKDAVMIGLGKIYAQYRSFTIDTDFGRIGVGIEREPSCCSRYGVKVSVATIEECLESHRAITFLKEDNIDYYMEVVYSSDDTSIELEARLAVGLGMVLLHRLSFGRTSHFDIDLMQDIILYEYDHHLMSDYVRQKIMKETKYLFGKAKRVTEDAMHSAALANEKLIRRMQDEWKLPESNEKYHYEIFFNDRYNFFAHVALNVISQDEAKELMRYLGKEIKEEDDTESKKKKEKKGE